MTGERDRSATSSPLGPIPGTVPSRTPGFAPGDLIAGRFRVVAFLSGGGMGDVYEVEDLELGARVALKMLRRDVAAGAAVRDRLRREIHLARQVTHRNVCRTFDVVSHGTVGDDGEAVQLTGLTMELLRGETLSSRLARVGPLTPAEALPLVRQLAAALDAAHAVGVIHRDFKSSNVILVPEDAGERVVVTDFGVARPGPVWVSASDGEDTFLGTADYMSPEQARGEAITPATDLYALGVVLFEMVTGERPHLGPTAGAVLRRRLAGPPPSPRAIVPTLDETWERAILSCLADDPGLRPASGEQLVRTLAGNDPRAWWSDAPWPGLAAAVVLAVVAAGLAISLQRVRPGPVDDPARQVQLTSWLGLEVDPSPSPDGRRLALSSNRSGRFEIYVGEAGRPAELVPLTSGGEQNFQPSWSPDGRFLVYASHGRGGLWVTTPAGGEAVQLTRFGSHPAWSPDGRWIVFQSDETAELAANAVAASPPSTLWRVTPDGVRLEALTRTGSPPGGHGAPAWSPDGRWLAFSVSGRRWSQLWAVDAEGGDPWPLVTGTDLAFDPSFEPDGDLLYAAVSQDESSTLWRQPLAGRRPKGESIALMGPGSVAIRHPVRCPATGDLLYTAFTLASNLWEAGVDPVSGGPRGEPRQLTFGSARHSRPRFSSNGAQIALDRWQIGASRDIWVMDADGARLRQVTTDPARDTQASWLPGDAELAFLSDRGGAPSLWACRLDGGGSRALATLSGTVDSVRVSPDGRLAAYHATDADGSVDIWLIDLASGEHRRLTDDPELVGFPCWSPDGRLLAAEQKRDDDDRVVLIDLASGGARMVVLTPEHGRFWPWSFSPDGRRIAMVALRDGAWNVWWVDRTSGEQRQLTDINRRDVYLRYPAWSPTGDRVVFELAEVLGDLWRASGVK